jgi:tetratricopeptide (TPR) repeat protein
MASVADEPVGRTSPSAIDWAAGVLVFALSLAVCAVTLTPTVALVDSGELTAASATLGVAHAPGVPTYTLLGWLFAKLPLRTVAVRLNLMSALFAALAAVMMYLVAREAIERAEHPAWSDGLGPATAALTLAFSRTLWAYAVVAEVYALNTFLVCAVLYLLLRWRSAVRAGAPSRPLLGLAAVTYGAALGVHHLTVLLALPGLLWLVWSTLGRRSLSTLEVALPAALVGLSVYAYLPWAASRDPLVNWGAPDDLRRFVRHVSAVMYQENVSSPSIPDLIAELRGFWALWSTEFTLAAPFVGLLGLLGLARRDRPLFWSLLAIALADVACAIWYRGGDDKDAYYLPAFLVTALGIGLAADRATRWARRRGKVPLGLGVAAAALFLALGVASNFSRNDKHRYWFAEDVVRNTLAGVEPGGLLLTAEWQFYSPLLYFRYVEGLRPDVTVVDIKLLQRAWYFRPLRREYPELIEACREPIEKFLHELERAESWTVDFQLKRKLMMEVIEAFIAHFMRTGRPVYVSLLTEPGLATRYAWVPSGLVFRLYADTEFRAEGGPVLQLRGINEGTAVLDAPARKVVDTYVNMLMNRGLYLAAYGRHEAAVDYYRRALGLERDHGRVHAPMYAVLGDSLLALGRRAEAVDVYRTALALDPGAEEIERKLSAAQAQS